MSITRDPPDLNALMSGLGLKLDHRAIDQLLPPMPGTPGPTAMNRWL